MGVTSANAVNASLTGGLSADDADAKHRLSILIRAYQVRGHLLAKVDPLGLQQPPYVDVLDPKHYGFTEADMSRVIPLSVRETFVAGFLAGSCGPQATIGDVIKHVQAAYSGYIGLEYMHIQESDKCNWIRSLIEVPNPAQPSVAQKTVYLDRLMWAHFFERYLATKWPTAKRFGLEGGESAIVGVKALVDKAGDLGVTNIVVGMPHRGRLSVLANVMRKPLASIFREFLGAKDEVLPDQADGTGDVKYHMGASCTRPTRNGKEVHLSLMANPSHLEAVNALVLGKTRCKQDALGDKNGDLVMPILFHGDASFAGQGIVYETMNFWELEGYKVGGTVHVVINNQVGFTTDPQDARSSPYCTAVAQAIGAPIFHVNGDRPEEVVRCFEIAMEFRQKYKKDVVIDLVCYRKMGHNEMDEPKFTQPLLYDKILKQSPTYELYRDHLVSSGVLTSAQVEDMEKMVRHHLDEAFAAAPSYKPNASDWLCAKWEGFKGAKQRSLIRNTGVPLEKLKDIGEKLCEIPQGFTPHHNLVKLFKSRREMFTHNKPLDWGTAELLAYGTLLREGHPVRLSGQDVRRGTFSHRHAYLVDQKTGAKHNVLSNLSPKQAPFYCFNSPLSEYGVLGFELGYSVESPNQLVLWEAQFGDFSNCAQVIIDQFIASGEAKWLRQAGLTMLLPHGYDGQGPEHSSTRIERYLQLVNSDPYTIPPGLEDDTSTQTQQCNMQVVYPTTPANMFHVLRRQVHREFRKPLICVTAKNLLRDPKCVSPLSDFDDISEVSPAKSWQKDTRFRRVIGETSDVVFNNRAQVDRVIFCTGKIYYELLQEREKRNLNNVALIRVEQLAPFPFDAIKSNAKQYPKAKFYWVQEEPFNAGAYSFVAPHFQTVLGVTPKYIGRPSSAAPSTGVLQYHNIEQAKVIKQAFELQ